MYVLQSLSATSSYKVEQPMLAAVPVDLISQDITSPPNTLTFQSECYKSPAQSLLVTE